MCALGYAIIGLALLLIVQTKDVFPQLVLARLLFSVGGAANSTMVTAILPSMIAQRDDEEEHYRNTTHSNTDIHDIAQSISSELTITPYRLQPETSSQEPPTSESPTRLAGIVGLFTGCGALLALGLFLRLPELFQRTGIPAGSALADSYYLMGLLSLVLSLVCFLGLRHLKGEEGKNWRALVHGRTGDHSTDSRETVSSFRSLFESTTLGFRNPLLGLSYLGGFVARGSSVGISLFIPLYVNAYYISSGLCDETGHNPQEIKENCRQAYVLAAELTGLSQLAALIFAPIFGYLADRYRRYNFPLLLAALLGVLGYVGLATLKSPTARGEEGSPWIFVIMVFLGISQIGAIVCSLGLLGRCVLGIEKGNNLQHAEIIQGATRPGRDDTHNNQNQENTEESTEDAPLLLVKPRSRAYLKGSIAGVYSLAGGVGILILTKTGGLMFDSVALVAPFYMLALFNLILLVIATILGIYDACRGT